MFECSICMYTCMYIGMPEERAPDLITDGCCEPPRGSWELNSGLLGERPVLVPAEPCHQLRYFYFIYLLEVVILFFMCSSVLACVSVCVSWRAEVGFRSPRSGVVDSCEPPCGYWELNPGSLQEQVLLTTEPSISSVHKF